MKNLARSESLFRVEIKILVKFTDARCHVTNSIVDEHDAVSKASAEFSSLFVHVSMAALLRLGFVSRPTL